MNENKLNKARELISGFLTEKRISAGLTQQKIADATGMGIATIKRFESGKFWLNQKQLILYCFAVGVDTIPIT